MIRVRQRLGKYRIDRRIADGGFATVFRAYDTVAGIPVALKVPLPELMTKETLADFRKEVRLTVRLDHPNILPIKDAGFIDGTFVIAYPLGTQSLADRLHTRMATRTMIAYAAQMLDALAFAHRQRVMHCDLKPENFILFADDRLRLADFGIARVARHTLSASGSGTVGYVAPEQAMGKPSFRSDVFSLGLLLYRMFTGRLPEWPFAWPPPGIERLRKNFHPDVAALLRRALAVNHRKRYADAVQMRAAFVRLQPRAVRATPTQRRRRRRATTDGNRWRIIRLREFRKRYGPVLGTRENCHRCAGPMAEAMQFCPWCASKRRRVPGKNRFPARCRRCKRGVKSDWRFCPWCFGPAIRPDAEHRFSDVRYAARCGNPDCNGKLLMSFMRYCPWCRRLVKKKWKIEGVKKRCTRCGWSVLPDYWDYCPWCGRTIAKR